MAEKQTRKSHMRTRTMLEMMMERKSNTKKKMDQPKKDKKNNTRKSGR